jgi:hypothetical protein
MGTIPPSVEWKRVDRGKGNGSLRRPFLDHKTLLVAFQVLSMAVRLARFLHDLFDGA